MIKFIYENESDIPAALKSNYALTDGKWVLQVEGAVAKSTVDAFRENNIALTKERDTLKEQFKGVDPTEYQSLKARAAELEEGKLIKKEGMEAAVEARVKTMREDYEKRLQETTGKLQSTTAEMGKLKIDTALIEHGTKMGLRPEATRDFVNRGRDIFALDDEGNVVAFESDRKTKKFGAAGTVLTIAEFVAQAAKDKDYGHLFQPSGGAGAQGGQKGAAPVGNPFKPGATFNLTAQAQLIRENPQAAAQMRTEATAST